MCRIDVKRRLACGNYSGEGERHSGVGECLFTFPLESLFTFARNRVHLQPGMIFTFTPESRSPSPGIPQCDSFIWALIFFSTLSSSLTQMTAPDGW